MSKTNSLQLRRKLISNLLQYETDEGWKRQLEQVAIKLPAGCTFSRGTLSYGKVGKKRVASISLEGEPISTLAALKLFLQTHLHMMTERDAPSTSEQRKDIKVWKSKVGKRWREQILWAFCRACAEEQQWEEYQMIRAYIFLATSINNGSISANDITMKDGLISHIDGVDLNNFITTHAPLYEGYQPIDLDDVRDARKRVNHFVVMMKEHYGSSGSGKHTTETVSQEEAA